MAEDADQPPARRSRWNPYPWADWLRLARRPGGVVLTRGVDFDAQPHGLAAMARTAARSRGLRVSAPIAGDSVTIKVL